MEFVKIGILGAIQGLTEFFPISSSGHLIVFRDWLGVNLAQPLAFDVALHVGTFLALMVFFYQEIGNLIRSWFASIWARSIRTPEERLPWLILLATLPAIFIGYFFEEWIDAHLRQPTVVAVMLVLIGIFMIVVERRAQGKRNMTELSIASAFTIGLAQALALIPGTSRSGITIITGMQQKLKRVQAARFSFLLSIPAIFGAALKQFFELRGGEGVIWDGFLIGALSSAIVGWIGLKFLMKFLASHSLLGFALYRFGLSFVIFITLIL